jgi:4-amino-4-deoxy-L-arabinose transferase-like glycosyltransferase
VTNARKIVLKDLGLIALVFGVLFFSMNGVRPLDNPDEGRYTEIPREMLESGDFVSPRLNGVLCFEKPPLFYWLQATALKVGGINERSSRFWPAGFALLGCLVTYLGGRSIFGRQSGFLGSMILGTSFLYFALSQVVILDMVVSVIISAALLVFLICVRQEPGRKRYFLSICFFTLLALATMTKGLIGLVIPCAVIFIWSLILNKWKALWPFYPLSGIVLFLAIAGPWHILAWKANPEFAWFYFVNEHFLRYLTPDHGRVQPFWFFFAILPVVLFPWIGFCFQAMVRPLTGGWRSIRERSDHLFLIIWILFTLLFFSASDSKLIPYILPLLPAFALLIGDLLSNARGKKGSVNLKAGTYVFIGGALLLAIALPILAIDRGERAAPNALAWSIAGSSVLFIGAIITLVVVRKDSGLTLLAIPFSTMFVFYLVFNPLGSAIRNNSTKSIALALKELSVPSAQVYSLLDYHQDLVPYLGGKVSVAACEPDEQTFGYSLEEQPARWLSEYEYMKEWDDLLPQFAISKKEKAEVFASEHPTWRAHVVMESNRYVLLTNQSGTALLQLEKVPLLASKTDDRSVPPQLEIPR